jgi:hypothetical protein
MGKRFRETFKAVFAKLEGYAKKDAQARSLALGKVAAIYDDSDDIDTMAMIVSVTATVTRLDPKLVVRALTRSSTPGTSTVIARLQEMAEEAKACGDVELERWAVREILAERRRQG